MGWEVTQDHCKYTIRKLGYGFLFNSIVNMALSCIISEIKRDIGQKSRFFIPHLHSTPPLWGPRRNIAKTFDVEKLE